MQPSPAYRKVTSDLVRSALEDTYEVLVEGEVLGRVTRRRSPRVDRRSSTWRAQRLEAGEWVPVGAWCADRSAAARELLNVVDREVAEGA